MFLSRNILSILFGESLKVINKLNKPKLLSDSLVEYEVSLAKLSLLSLDLLLSLLSLASCFLHCFHKFVHLRCVRAFVCFAIIWRSFLSRSSFVQGTSVSCRGILVYNICLISIDNSVSDGAINKSVLHVERTQ